PGELPVDVQVALRRPALPLSVRELRQLRLPAWNRPGGREPGSGGLLVPPRAQVPLRVRRKPLLTGGRPLDSKRGARRQAGAPLSCVWRSPGVSGFTASLSPRAPTTPLRALTMKRNAGARDRSFHRAARAE